MNEEKRLRQHPAKRFAAPEHFIDLRQAIVELRREPHKGINGHRQIALYRHGPVECFVFVFEEHGGLADHAVNGGPVAIEVIEGTLSVKTPDATHEMKTGSLLLLAPGVVHSLIAEQPSSMLLTVYRDDPTLSPAE